VPNIRGASTINLAAGLIPAGLISPSRSAALHQPFGCPTSTVPSTFGATKHCSCRLEPGSGAAAGLLLAATAPSQSSPAKISRTE